MKTPEIKKRWLVSYLATVAGCLIYWLIFELFGEGQNTPRNSLTKYDFIMLLGILIGSLLVLPAMHFCIWKLVALFSKSHRS